jgi:hypothetical protein
MNTEIGIMLESLTALVPIVRENMVTLNAHSKELDVHTDKLNKLTNFVFAINDKVDSVADMSVAAFNQANTVSERLDAFVDRQKAIAEAYTPAALKSWREMTGKNAREYAERHHYNAHNAIESLIWNFKKDTGIDLRQLSKDAGNLDPFDIAENLGKSQDLLLLSIRMFVGK